MRIEDIRQAREFAETVIDRIWHAWWKDKGHLLEVIRANFETLIRSNDPLPCCLVARTESLFLGMVLVIWDDLEERPALSPWIAALWVEPEYRQTGIATALLTDAVARCRAEGVKQVFLHSYGTNRPFYEARGFTLFEAGVPDPTMHILSRALS